MNTIWVVIKSSFCLQKDGTLLTWNDYVTSHLNNLFYLDFLKKVLIIPCYVNCKSRLSSKLKKVLNSCLATPESIDYFIKDRLFNWINFIQTQKNWISMPFIDHFAGNLKTEFLSPNTRIHFIQKYWQTFEGSLNLRISIHLFSI